jgi:hypothetical protein
MEEKTDIKPYHCDIDALNLNNWLHQLEVYFSFHNIDEKKNCCASFVTLVRKIEVLASSVGFVE